MAGTLVDHYNRDRGKHRSYQTGGSVWGANPGLNSAIGMGAALGTQAIDAFAKPTAIGASIGKGALSGAAMGATVGSIVPGIGTAIGGAVGAVVGGAAGWIGGAKKKREASAQMDEYNRITNEAKLSQSNAAIANDPSLMYGNQFGEYYEMGGPLSESYHTHKAQGGSLVPLDSATVEVDGRTHAQGGVLLPEVNAEVEDGETISSGFVFSDELGFAAPHKKLAKARGKIEDKPQTFERKNAISILDRTEQGLALSQEFLKAERGLPSEVGNFQDGGLMNKSRDIKTFYTEYMTSPNYTKRLMGMGYNNPSRTASDRLSNVNQTKVVEIDNWGSRYNPDSKTVIMDPTEISKYGDNSTTVLAHEMAHAAGAKGYDPNDTRLDNSSLNRKEILSINERNRNLGTGHDGRAAEVKADLDALRYRLKRDNIYDTGTQEFNNELLKKAKEKYKGDNYMKRLFDSSSDDDLVWMMNNIAFNSSSGRRLNMQGRLSPEVRNFQDGGKLKQGVLAVNTGSKKIIRKDGVIEYNSGYDPQYPEGNPQFSLMLNGVEVLDPTGISSWGDIRDAWNDPNRSVGSKLLESSSAIPILGNLKRMGLLGKGIYAGTHTSDISDVIEDTNKIRKSRRNK